MTRDDIIRMAREATDWGDDFNGLELVDPQTLVRFAQLVAAHEREACAALCESSTAAWTESSHNEACMACAAAIRASNEYQPRKAIFRGDE